jgi:hypothetical protein
MSFGHKAFPPAARFSVVRMLAARALAACAFVAMLAVLLTPAAAAEAVFPTGSRLGLTPPPGLQPARSFPGFEDLQNGVFVRLVALPGAAFPEIEKTMTNEALKKQGMTVEKRESLPLSGGNAILAVVRQETTAGRIRKWLLIAAVDNLTALVSLEMSAKPPAPYTDAAIRTALGSLTARATIPDEEQLSLVPFKMGDAGGMRLVRVVPGVAAHYTDGPKDTLEATEQPHLVIAATPGGPQQPADRDKFARSAFSGLPPFKDVRIVNSEPMRIGGQAGHEVRARGKDPQTGLDIEIVQWLRFGTGAYLRILAFAPADKWTDMFTRFRAVRDGLEPR